MQTKKRIGASELILNPDGSVFHLHMRPEDLAQKVILVGDPDRVGLIASYFDKVEVKRQNREFVSCTGYYKNTRITALSTGIGTDNIDIVMNELDALCNIDFASRTVKDKLTQLEIVRIGTSGGLQEDLPVDTTVISSISGGIDCLLSYYKSFDSVCDLNLLAAFQKHTNWQSPRPQPYFVHADADMLQKMTEESMYPGITISAPGFYGPQARVLRLEIADRDINNKLNSFRYDNFKIANYEMESAGIYGLSKLLGHKAVTLCKIIANRRRQEYSRDYKKGIALLVEDVLDKFSNL